MSKPFSERPVKNQFKTKKNRRMKLRIASSGQKVRGLLTGFMWFGLPGLFSCLLIIAAVLIVSGTFGTAGAATITVDDNHDYASAEVISDSDAYGCTLRKALQNANDGAQTYTDCNTGSAGADIIGFGSVTADFQQGTKGYLAINKNITITVTGTKKFIGIGGGTEIFRVTGATAKLTMDGFTLQNASNGAVTLWNQANFSMNGGTFDSNTSGSGGGAISGTGTISLNAVHFTDNSSTSGSGGAIELSNSGGSSSIKNSWFDGNTANNSGGAIYYSGASSGPLTITNTLFAGVSANTAHAAGGASNGGGAIFSSASGSQSQVSIVNCSFMNNTVDGNDGRGGAIFNAPSAGLPMVVLHSIFGVETMLTKNTVSGGANGMGGAIYTRGNILILNSTFIGNDAGSGKGGAIASDAPPAAASVIWPALATLADYLLDPIVVPPWPKDTGAIVGNSTIYNNSADQGGAVYSFGQGSSREISLINVTIDSNTAGSASGGGGIYNTGQGTVRLSNTIVSNNTANSSGDNCNGSNPAVVNTVTNLQWPNNTCAAAAPITVGDPKLDAPSINGPDILTLTMSLNAGSAASNAGDNATCLKEPIFDLDQRSFIVPIRPDGGPNCDIGAYESSMAPGYSSVPAPASTITIDTLTSVPGTKTVIISNTGDDNLIIGSYAMTTNSEITVSGTVPPFTIGVGLGTETLTLTCLSGTPGSYSDTLTVNHNASGSPATYTINCNVTEPLVITTASPLPAGTVGIAYSQTFAAAGGTVPYTNWAVAVGTLPANLLLNAATGALTGTPTTAGTSNFTIQVTDSAAVPVTATKAFSLTINAAALTITTASPLPAGTVGIAYSQTFAAAGGTVPYTNWAVAVGTLPANLLLNAATGALTGTPTTAGTSNFTIQVTDSAAVPVTATKAFSLTINAAALTITTASPLPAGTVGIAYSQTFAAAGGTVPYTNWAVAVGTLPANLLLNAATGALTGTPTTAGTSNFTIQVTDSAAVPVTATKAFSLTINAAALTITTASPLPAGTVGIAYSQTFAAAGGTVPYTNWAVAVGTLPANLLLNAATGALTGTPTTAGTSNFTIQVTDSAAVPVTATKAFSLTINAAALTITTASPLPAGTVGIAYSQTFAAAGGTVPYTNWAVAVGTLPANLLLNAATGALTGTPTTAGTSNFTIQVTDSAAVPVTATKAFSLTINAAALTITTASPLPAGTVGIAYSQTFAAAGGTVPYTNWAVAVGTLPANLLLNAATGALTGTPTTAGTSNFTIQVTDSAAVPVTATKAFSLTINAAALTITTASPLPAGTVGIAYSQTFAAAGGTVPYTNWAVAVGTLPANLLLNAATGALTGTPTTAGTSNFTIQVTDSAAVPVTATKAFSLTINAAALTITTASPLPAGTVGIAYSQTFAAAGGTVPYTNWAVAVGTLPANLLLNAATGALTGTPTTAGTSNFTIQVTDSAAVPVTATKAFSLTINAAALTITTASPLPAGTVGIAYSQTFAAAGGTVPYTNWAVAVGTLPANLLLNAATGALTGTPTTAGTSNFTIQVTDSAAVPVTATKAFSLTINAPVETTAIPTMNEWGMIILTVLLGTVSVYYLRRRKLTV